VPLSELDFKLAVQMNITARTTREGASFRKPSYGFNSNPSFNLAHTIANAAAGGANSAIGKVFEAAASGTVDVDLQAFEDIAEQAAQSVVRLKVLVFQLLRAADDADNGNACTGCEVTPHATNGFTSLIKAAGDAIKLQSGQICVFATPSAGGWTVGATNKVLTITNTDATLPARVLVVAAGGST
jgi:hypothetical protein